MHSIVHNNSSGYLKIQNTFDGKTKTSIFTQDAEYKYLYDLRLVPESRMLLELS